jgi:hypothetical protein
VLQWCEFIPIQVQTNVKLPILYLVDCIAKNIGQTYTTLFSQNIVKTFCSVFKVVSYLRRPVSTGVEIIIFGAEEVPKNVSFMFHFVVFFFLLLRWGRFLQVALRVAQHVLLFVNIIITYYYMSQDKTTELPAKTKCQMESPFCTCYLTIHFILFLTCSFLYYFLITTKNLLC